ncbi:MAG: hypothetical protein M3436_01480 [Pseudomonadota bacterium]|nr:hypothetical protein [Pseudomonadota bacterium]
MAAGRAAVTDRFKPPAPVYRPCVLCGRKHRMRPDGSSKTGETLTEERVLSEYVRVPAGTLICFGCRRPPVS